VTRYNPRKPEIAKNFAGKVSRGRHSGRRFNDLHQARRRFAGDEQIRINTMSFMGLASQPL